MKHMKSIGKHPKTGKALWAGKQWSHGSHRAVRYPGSKYVKNGVVAHS